MPLDRVTVRQLMGKGESQPLGELQEASKRKEDKDEGRCRGSHGHDFLLGSNFLLGKFLRRKREVSLHVT